MGKILSGGRSFHPADGHPVMRFYRCQQSSARQGFGLYMQQQQVWSSAQFSHYLPFMDNLSVHNKTRPRGKDGQISHYRCRIRKESQE